MLKLFRYYSYYLREFYHSRLLTMQGHYHGCHKKTEMERIKGLTARGKISRIRDESVANGHVSAAM